MTPRHHHYFFSSILIPDLLFSDPQTFFDRSQISPDFFASELWEMNSKVLGINSSDVIDSTDLKSENFSEAEIQGILFTMPPALCQAETIASCAIGTVNAGGFIISVRYFTLERGESENTSDAVFCEWKGKQHINHGTYVPDIYSFKNECIEMCKKLHVPVSNGYYDQNFIR